MKPRINAFTLKTIGEKCLMVVVLFMIGGFLLIWAAIEWESAEGAERLMRLGVFAGVLLAFFAICREVWRGYH
jgi:hypothetical protein